MALVDRILNDIKTLNLAVFDGISYIFCACAVLVFISLSYTSAPYGRYFRKGWGPALNSRLAWFIFESPSFLIPIFLIYYVEPSKLNLAPNLIMLGCFLLHYFHRSLVYPFLIKGNNPCSVTQLVSGLIYCTVNAYLQCGYLIKHADLGQNWKQDPYFYGGGMFEYVSGANFFGEILEWLGFAIACRTLPAFTFFFFTVGAIGPRAFSHHRWYLDKFKDYPKERKALIPFLI